MLLTFLYQGFWRCSGARMGWVEKQQMPARWHAAASCQQPLSFTSFFSLDQFRFFKLVSVCNFSSLFFPKKIGNECGGMINCLRLSRKFLKFCVLAKTFNCMIGGTFLLFSKNYNKSLVKILSLVPLGCI